MKKSLFLVVALVFILSNANAQVQTINFSNVSLSGGSQAGFFSQIWDLTKNPMTLSFTVDLNGMVDDFGGSAHAWSEMGIRQVGSGNFNPNGNGVWLATDYEWTANTFNPDPPGAPSLDLDDKLILQRISGQGEGAYNLPSTPPVPGNNHRFWFDRDGVDPWQGGYPAANGGTYNTGGIYNIVMTLSATSPSLGTAFMTINGLSQGFETNGNWSNIELTPAGMTFTGDMTQMQIFYGLYGYGATHSASFSNISANGYVIPEPGTILLLGSGFLGLGLVGYFRRKRA